MSNVLTIRNPAIGLHVQANSFSAIADGSYEKAENVVFSRDGIIEKRRGYETLATLSNPIRLFELNSTLYLIDGTSIKEVETDGTLNVIVTDASLLAFSNIEARVIQNESVAYITSDVGMLKFNGTTLTLAGLPRGLDVTVSFTSARTGPIVPDSQVQYRYTYERGDLESAPSSAGVIVNSLTSASASESSLTVTVTSTAHGLSTSDLVRIKNSDATNVDGDYTITVTGANTFTFTITAAPGSALSSLDWGIWKTTSVEVALPTGIGGVAAGDSVRLYRSLASSDEDIAPSDELQLTTEEVITAGEISAKKKTITDSLDELFLADYLYTNANSGIGITQANDRPPLAEDLTLYKGYTFYANTESLDSYTVNLISTTNISNDDTIVIAGETYTFKTAGEDAANKYVDLEQSSTTSINIDTTARSLVRIINQASTKVYGIYLSGANDVPGQILIQARNYSIGSFTVQCANAGSEFLPNITTAQSSADTDNPHYLYYSKADTAEAVPALNFFEVDASNDAILRVVGLRDSVVIIKEHSVYKLVGETSQDFTVTKIDDTVSCIAASSVAKVNNQVFMLSDQGIVQINENGITLTSRAIEPLLLNIVGNSNISSTVGIGYETDRLYLLSTIEPYSSTPDTIYCYNIVTQGFSTWDFYFEDAIVHNDKMHYFVGTTLFRERKARNKLDYSNDTYAATVGEVQSTTSCFMTFADDNLPTSNDVFVFDDLIYRITDVSAGAGGNLITFATAINFEETDVGAIYEGYSCEIVSAPITGGEIGKLKRFSEFQAHFRNSTPNQLEITFKTDQYSDSAQTSWVPATTSFGWGSQPWGFFPWGEEESVNLPYVTGRAEKCRVYIPRESARATFIQHRIIHNIAAEPLLIQSFSYVARLLNHVVDR